MSNNSQYFFQARSSSCKEKKQMIANKHCIKTVGINENNTGNFKNRSLLIEQLYLIQDITVWVLSIVNRWKNVSVSQKSSLGWSHLWLIFNCLSNQNIILHMFYHPLSRLSGGTRWAKYRKLVLPLQLHIWTTEDLWARRSVGLL